MKKFFEEPDPLILIPYDASDDGDGKHKFQRFWTWDFENGAKVTLGTTLDDLYKEDSSRQAVQCLDGRIPLFLLKVFHWFMLRVTKFKS